MNIAHLGELTPDPQVEAWMVSPEVEIPCFPGTRLRFILMDFRGDPAPDEFTAAVRNPLGLSVERRMEATACVFKNYVGFVASVGEEDVDVKIAIPSDVWEHVQPTGVYVQRGGPGDKVYVSITAECAWEQEHGLQIVYREGSELSRMSDQDGHLTNSEAYALPDGEDYIC